MHVSFSAALVGAVFCALPALALAQAPAPTSPAPASPILVPAGCASTTLANGQVVITCPTTPPASGQAPAPSPPLVATPPAAIPPAPVYVAPATERKWYGWQTLIVDGAVVVATVAIGPVSSEGAAATFLVGHALGGPIVHWSNGQVGKGFASLGLRVGGPLGAGLIGAGIGAAAGGCETEDCTAPVIGAAFGIVLGYIASVVVDSAALAYKTVPVPQRAAAPKLRWTPVGGYDPKQRTVNVGIGGTF